MTTRTSIRPRPVDFAKQLEIIRDPDAQLDISEVPAIRDTAKDADAASKVAEQGKEGAKGLGKDGTKPNEIPVPAVIEVPTYTREYLPTFREPTTYIRGRGGVGYRDDHFVEYDMDSDDEKWLSTINAGGQERLPPMRFELMIWKLEMANAAAIDRTFSTAAGGDQRSSASVVASTDHMDKEEALEHLAAACPARDKLRAAVYAYWLRKRKKAGRPLLRSLQAPTPLSDGSPFNVFRPRERIHRPQTRRRRENNEEAMEKMRSMQANLLKARDVVEQVMRRERKKRDSVYTEVDAAQLQLKLRHEPRSAVEAIEAQYAEHARQKPGRRPLGFEAQAEGVGNVAIAAAKAARAAKRRKRDVRNPQRDAISQLPPAPFELTEALLAPQTPDLPRLCNAFGEASLRLPPQVASAVAAGRGRPRAGRGGRLIIDRCHPVTYESYGAEGDDAEVPLHSLPNPYGGASRPGTPAAGDHPAASRSQPTEPQPLSVTPKPSAARPQQPQQQPQPQQPQAAPVTPGSTRTSTRKAAARAAVPPSTGPPKRGPGRPPKKGGSPMDTS